MKILVSLDSAVERATSRGSRDKVNRRWCMLKESKASSLQTTNKIALIRATEYLFHLCRAGDGNFSDW